MTPVSTDFWRQVLRHDRLTFLVPISMYRNQDLLSSENPILSDNQNEIPTSPSVYGRVRSWLLQDQGSAQPQLYHGLVIHRKVTTPLRNSSHMMQETVTRHSFYVPYIVHHITVNWRKIKITNKSTGILYLFVKFIYSSH